MLVIVTKSEPRGGQRTESLGSDGHDSSLGEESTQGSEGSIREGTPDPTDIYVARESAEKGKSALNNCLRRLMGSIRGHLSGHLSRQTRLILVHASCIMYFGTCDSRSHLNIFSDAVMIDEG